MISAKLFNPALISVTRRLRLPTPSIDVTMPYQDPEVLVDHHKFTVKVQSTHSEALRVQKLRYDVFHREFRGKKFPFGLDRDAYDRHAEQLIVIEKDTGKLVGTYRAILSDDQKKFYTASEFDISAFTALPGKKLELSRACIHRDYRSGLILTLLWRAVAEYTRRSGASWLFGIPSVKTVNTLEAVKVWQHFSSSGRVNMELPVKPHAHHRLDDFGEVLAQEEAKALLSSSEPAEIPPLFYAYIRAGAKIIGEPAIDREFQCIDFFTALKMDDMSKAYKRKYTS